MAVLLVALLAGAAAFGGPAQAAPSAPPFPQVSIKITSVSPVNVETDADVIITTNGSVNLTLPSSFEVTVYLNVTITTTYWDASITPMQATVTGSGEIPFTVTVSVPGRSSAQANAQIQVDANVSAYGVGRTFSNSTDVPIKQYYGVELTSSTGNSPETFEATTGADTAFAFQLQNIGNGRDSFEIRVANLADLQSRGIAVDVPTPVANVAEKLKVNVNARISLPFTAALDNYTIEIQAVSTGAVSTGGSVMDSTAKTARAVPPLPGNNGTDPNNTTKPPTGFLPGFDVIVTAAAVGFAAAAWRRFRPPSQGGAYRESPGPSLEQAP